ncbi:hypothetical protein N5C93_16140 [Pseudomonas nitroreducens]|nr:hypothetical protein [Pseudomonas nitroreducens]MDH1074373.1 hypothetical protein [Pseudomonas nitroreducens]NMZ73036.1 hypothetical protein [Pseudomonas nitroreducens]
MSTQLRYIPLLAVIAVFFTMMAFVFTMEHATNHDPAEVIQTAPSK